MQIIYPCKTSSDIRSEIQRYTDAHEKSRKFPTWWVFVSIIWSLLNVFFVLIALRATYHVMSHATEIHFNVLESNGDFMVALFVIALCLLAVLLASSVLRNLIRGLISPEWKKSEDYFNTQLSLRNLLKDYMNAEQLEKDGFSDVTFQMLEKTDTCGNHKKDLYISTVSDGFKKDFCFKNGTYKVTTSEDNTNTIDLSLLDSLVDDMTSKTVITN